MGSAPWLCLLALGCSGPAIQSASSEPLRLDLQSFPQIEAGERVAIDLPVSGPKPISVTATGVPAGLTVADRVLSGIPQASGDFLVHLHVTSADGKELDRDVPLSIVPALTITNPSKLPFLTGQPVDVSLQASDGMPPYYWAPVDLPTGLAFDAGHLFGSLVAAGQYAVQVAVSDSAGVTRKASLSLDVAEPLQLHTDAASTGNVGNAYNGSIWTTGGTGPITVGIESGPVPPGLTFSNGALTGTPTAGGTYGFLADAEDSDGRVAHLGLSILIFPNPAPSTAPTWIPDGIVGQPYAVDLIAAYGAQPYTWTGTDVPAGLTLDSAGHLSGTPIAVPTTAALFTVTDANGQTASVSLERNVIRLAVELDGGALPDAYVGAAYRHSIAPSSGVASVGAQDVPPGMSGNYSLLAGTPTDAGTYALRLMADDHGAPAQHVNAPAVIRVRERPALTSTVVGDGLEGLAYQQKLQAEKGLGPYGFSIVDGGLPPGIAISNDGTLSGTPSATGAFTSDVQITDANGAADTEPLSIQIQPTIAIASGMLTDLAVGQSPADGLQVLGGQPPYTWSVAGGALPDGLALNPDGTLSGTTAAAGNFMFSAQVADSATPVNVSTHAIQMRVFAPPVLPAQALPEGALSWAFAHALRATGGKAPLQFSVAAGSLPPGIELTSDGALTGMPGQTGSFAFTVQVADALAQTASQSYSIDVVPAVVMPPAVLPDGVLDQPYSFQIAAQGGGGALTFTLRTELGALDNRIPSGMTLSNDGVLSGTIGTWSSYPFKVSVSDPSGVTAWQTFHLWVPPPPWLIGTLARDRGPGR